MKILKHILVVVALLATMVPCGHAAMHHHHHDHHHDGVALCGVAAEPCSCHSCGHLPGADKLEIQTDRTSTVTATERPAIRDLLFCLPKTIPVFRSPHPLGVGILAELQTVQLLI